MSSAGLEEVEDVNVDAAEIETGSRSATSDARAAFPLGKKLLSIDDLLSIVRGDLRATLPDAIRSRLVESADAMDRLHARGDSIYGVTTSVGGSVDTIVPNEQAADLSLNVLRMHGCGFGRFLDESESAAVLVARLASLVQGMSGVRLEVIERIVDHLDHRVLPQIPSEGSVGASGDLTPLSYLAATLVGEREVLYEGATRQASDVLGELGWQPIEFRPKEALALMNGTSVSTALASIGWARARRLGRVAAKVSAANVLSVQGNASHFDERIHAAKRHLGQQTAARWIREDLAGMPQPAEVVRLQDRYSLRCSPHVIGVLVDALRWSGEAIEGELNSVSDNPLIDVEADEVLHGGNFYGGHVAFACDSLKAAVANVACLLDRQILLLCSPVENAGLPTDLAGVSGPEGCSHNGFKAASIAASSMAAEAMKLTMPASAFSRSTELHNQDKVPMATTAARDLLRVTELAEQVLSIALLASCQALDLRGVEGSGSLDTLRRRIRDEVPTLGADRRMDIDLQATLALLRADALADREIGL